MSNGIGDGLMREVIKRDGSHVVFDENKITPSELNKTLNNDFKNSEEIQALLKNAPKFGNDIDEVDNLAREGALV